MLIDANLNKKLPPPFQLKIERTTLFLNENSFPSRCKYCSVIHFKGGRWNNLRKDKNLGISLNYVVMKGDISTISGFLGAVWGEHVRTNMFNNLLYIV